MIKLEISRLLLRPRRAQDFEAFSDFYTDEELSRYVGGLRMTSLSHLLSRPALVSPRIKRMNGFVNAVKKTAVARPHCAVICRGVSAVGNWAAKHPPLAP